MRRPRAAAQVQDRCGRFGDAVLIRERPAEACDRALPGHWEGDLLLGRGKSQIATLVERASRCSTASQQSATRDPETPSTSELPQIPSTN